MKPKKYQIHTGTARKKSAEKKLEALHRANDLDSARDIAEPAERAVAVDRWVRTWIRADLLKGEPYLTAMMHPSNLGTTPLQRTEQFAGVYVLKYRELFAKHVDPRVGPKKKPIDLKFAMNSIGDMNALWRARAEADALGVTYGEYLRIVMEGKLRNGKWTHAGQPNQLYGALDVARVRGRPGAASGKPVIVAPVFGGRPACFGYPHWNLDAPCATCPFGKRCYDRTQAVDAAILESTGVPDPIAARARRQSADRQRRWYAKNRKRLASE